jgi:hypothetical protein
VHVVVGAAVLALVVAKGTTGARLAFYALVAVLALLAGFALNAGILELTGDW